MEDCKNHNDKNARQIKKVNGVMKKKTLYIRLDSSPLPEESDEIIVKDFNLENYFCTLLGRRLLEDAMFTGTISYPGKLIADFKEFDKEAYKEILQQWEKILSALLISQSENDKDFLFKLPDSYISWLDRCDIPNAFQIKNYYTHATSVSIKRKYLFAIVHEVLKNKLDYFLQKNKGNIDRIVFSIDGINRNCYIVHLWKHILTRDYEIVIVKDFNYQYKVWNKNRFLPIHNVVLGETPLKKIKQMHNFQDDLGVIYWDDANHYLSSKEWFHASNSGGIINLYAIKRDRAFPVLWKNVGFDWKMSFLDWIDLLDKLNFNSVINRAPCVLNGHYGRYFSATITAKTVDYKLIFNFEFGNELGGETEESKDTLNSIIVKNL